MARSTAELLDALQRLRLLEPEQLDELTRDGADASSEPPQLVETLLTRGWLTRYQADRLLHGHEQGLVLGSYILLEHLGEGGMGAVFKARHEKLGRVVALKVIRKERLESPDAVKRFQREVRAAAQLNHPHIVLAFDADQADDTHFMAMEYIEGTDLARLVREQGPLPVAAACEYVRQAALGLQHAFEKGMVHRDIKPHNLLLDGKGTVKVLDMGLARLSRPDAGEESSSTLTKEGSVMGTVDYIAPEQAMDSHTVDIRADLYSLGCTLYFLLTGKVPFPGGDALSKLMKHKLDEPVPVEQLRPDVPPAVAAVLRTLMAKEPRNRFQTPAEAAAALTAAVQERLAFAQPAGSDTLADVSLPPRPARSRPWALRTAMAGLFLLVLLGGFLFLLMHSDRPPASSQAAGTRSQTLPVTQATPIRVPAIEGMPPLAIAPFNEKEAKQHQQRWSDYLTRASAGTIVPTFGNNTIGMKLALIPPGEFLMGSPEGETNAINDEKPQHKVRISRPFYVGVYEVTQAEWTGIMGNLPPEYGKTLEFKADHPIGAVNWFGANQFCERLSALPEEQRAGRRYRLPTEAEWEYACRAGTASRFHCGDSLGINQANFGSAKAVKVGSYPANAFGLHDMHGNVVEWCADWYEEAYFRRSPPHDPSGPTEGTARVSRGGSWKSPQEWRNKSAFRYHDWPNTRHLDQGFRVVCDIAVPPPPGTIDLLPLIDPARDKVSGIWQVNNSGEFSSAAGEVARIQVPYRPPDEYDLRVAFTRTAANDSVGVMLVGGGRQFRCGFGGLGNSAVYIADVDGKPRVTRMNGALLQNGRRYEVFFQVRKNGIKAFLDGELAMELKTDFKNVTTSPNWALRDVVAFGLGTHNSSAIFHKVEVVEISGPGTFTRPDDPAAKKAAQQRAAEKGKP